MSSFNKFAGAIGSLWGLSGILLLLSRAVDRLYPYAIELLDLELTLTHTIGLLVSIIFMAYSEGYKGFQKQFSPRVVSRARYLCEHPRIIDVIFAPFFCMAFYAAPPKRRIITYCLTTGIIILIIMVRQLTQPWRGIVDAGVVIGLAWGMISIFIHYLISAVKSDWEYPHEINITDK